MASTHESSSHEQSHDAVWYPCRKVTAVTDVLLFEWDIGAVVRMAGDTYPGLAAAWRSLTLYAIGSAFSSTCGDVSGHPSRHGPSRPGMLL